MGKKNNMSAIVLLLCIIIVLLIAIIGYLLFKNPIKDTPIKEDDTKVEETVVSEEDTIKEVVYTEDELFNKLKGVWKYTNDLGGSYIVSWIEDEFNNNAKTFSYVQYATDGPGVGGEITSTTYLGNNIYRIKTFQKGCHGNDCYYEYDDKNDTIDINITNINSKKVDIKVGNEFITCEYVTDSWKDIDKYFSY